MSGVEVVPSWLESAKDPQKARELLLLENARLRTQLEHEQQQTRSLAMILNFTQSQLESIRSEAQEVQKRFVALTKLKQAEQDLARKAKMGSSKLELLEGKIAFYEQQLAKADAVLHDSQEAWNQSSQLLLEEIRASETSLARVKALLREALLAREFASEGGSLHQLERSIQDRLRLEDMVREFKIDLARKESEIASLKAANRKFRTMHGDLVMNRGKLFGGRLQDAPSSDQDGIPWVIRGCVDYLRKNALLAEGIFRIPGSTDAIQALRKAFEGQDHVVFQNVHDAAGLLKMYLRELDNPGPLIPFPLYNSFLDVQRQGHAEDVEEKSKKFKGLLELMPRENAIVLKYLLNFLADVAKYSETNLMSEHNLAIVFAPTLLRPELETRETQILDGVLATECVRTLITVSRRLSDVVEEKEQVVELKQDVRSPGRVSKTLGDSDQLASMLAAAETKRAVDPAPPVQDSATPAPNAASPPQVQTSEAQPVVIVGTKITTDGTVSTTTTTTTTATTAAHPEGIEGGKVEKAEPSGGPGPAGTEKRQDLPKVIAASPANRNGNGNGGIPVGRMIARVGTIGSMGPPPRQSPTGRLPRGPGYSNNPNKQPGVAVGGGAVVPSLTSLPGGGGVSRSSGSGGPGGGPPRFQQAKHRALSAPRQRPQGPHEAVGAGASATASAASDTSNLVPKVNGLGSYPTSAPVIRVKLSS